MAEIIGTAIVTAVASAEVASTAIIGTLTVAQVVGTGVLLVGSAALSLATSGATESQKIQGQQFPSAQPLPVRQRSYGRVKLAGPFLQKSIVGGNYYYALYHGEGPWEAIEEWWLDATYCPSVPADGLGGTVRESPWRGLVSFDSRLGTSPQPAAGQLIASGLDATHMLNGCAYTVVTNIPPVDVQKNFKSYYPKGTWSNLRVTARTARVRNLANPAHTADPATWGFSPVSAVCIYDFLTHPKWGLRVPPSLMNVASWRTAGLRDAEILTAKDGGRFNRYYLGGTYQMTDDPADVLAQMLGTRDGELTLEPDGTIGIKGGYAPVPTVTLTDDDILSIQYEAGNGTYAAFNQLKLSYVSPIHDYQVVEGQAWIDATSQAQTGELLEQDFARPWVQWFNQARRLAKIAMAKGNPALKLTIVTKLSGAAALFEEAILLDSQRLPLVDGLVFLVGRAAANIEAGTCTFDLTSLDPACYSFDAQTEEGTPPTLPNAVASPAPPANPDTLQVSIERRAISGATTAAFLRLTATAPARTDVSLIGRYRIAGAPDYVEMTQDGADPFSLTSAVLQDGASYDVEGAVATYERVQVSDFLAADPDPITVTADTTSPGPPSGLSATGGAGQHTVSFTAPDSSAFASARIFRGTSATFADAAPVGTTINGAPSQAFSRTTTGVAAGSYNVWVRAYNASGYGDAASTIGPVQVTVT